MSMPTDESVNLLDYLAIIVQYRRMVVFTTVAIFVVSIVISLQLPKVYSSTSRILAPQQDMGLMGLVMGQAGAGASLASDILGKSATTEMYAGVLKSEVVKGAIIDRFNLIKVYKQKYRIDTYKEIDNHVTIVAGKKDGIVSITVEDRDPNRAAEMTNAFVEELARIITGINVIGARQNRIFLEERLKRIKTDLSAAEEALKSFSLKNKAIHVTEQVKATIEGIAKLKAQLAVQEVNLARFRSYLSDFNQEIVNTKAGIANIKSQI